MIKKIGVIFLTAMLGVTTLTGCGNEKQDTGTERIQESETLKENTVTTVEIQENENSAESVTVTDEEQEAEKKTIICTAFPEYDWVCEILGEKKAEYDVKFLLESGVDIHSYQPTAEDIAEISNCDLFVYTGGVSEGWIEDTLENATNETMQVVILMEVLGERLKHEELVEGMEHVHENAEDEESADENHEDGGHSDENHEGDDHSDDAHEVAAYDEHVWLSLKNAEVFVNELKNALIELDSENQVTFEQNAENYQAELLALDGEYQKTVDAASDKTILFGDRFPFRYLTEDYGLEYYAAFTGCSAETEASFETVTFLAGKLDELGLPAVLVIENSDQKLAQTIVNSTKERDQQILVMNSLQSVNAEDMANGVTYLSVMEDNLKILKAALSLS